MKLFSTLFDKKKEILWTHQTDETVFGVCFSPDNSLIAAGSRKGSLYVLDRSGNLLWKYKTKPEEALVSASISADGSMLAIGSTDNKIYLSDIKEFQ